MNWITQTFIAVALYCVNTLLLRALTDSGVRSDIINLGLAVVAIPIFAGLIISSGSPSLPSQKSLWILVAAGTAFAVGNYFIVNALGNSPNPGFVRGVQALQILIVSVAAVPLYGSPFTLSKAFGGILCIVGVWLLGR